MYAKRSGTCQVHGHLYETKLLSLILFKTQRDENVKSIFLATNMDKTGAFDDISFKAKIKDYDRPLAVFMQAKHSKSNTAISINNRDNLIKYFNSYQMIRNRFNPMCDDCIFNEEYNDIDCRFVMYTTAKTENNVDTVENPEILNNIIATGQTRSQPLYIEKNVQLLSKIITATVLAETFAKFLYAKLGTQRIMLTNVKNDILMRYHVILAKKVVDVSKIENGDQRSCKFRIDFFTTTDAFLVIFRESFYIEILKMQKQEDAEKEENLSNFLLKPCESTLSKVIGSVILYKDGKFEYTQKQSSLTAKEELKQIYMPQSTVKLVTERTAVRILETIDDIDPVEDGNPEVNSLNNQPEEDYDDEEEETLNDVQLQKQHFTVPINFGNTDVRKNNENNLKAKIVNFMETAVEYEAFKVVTITNDVNDGILKLNTGLGRAVGNMLIEDSDNGFLKFVDDDSNLDANGQNVLKQLKDLYNDLDVYRFDIKVSTFPKLSYDCVDEELTRDFLSKLVYYTEQASHDGVQNILDELIQTTQIKLTQNFRIKSDAIFLKYHDAVQEWWITPGTVKYFTKTPNLYEQIVKDIVDNPLISITSMMYMNKVKAMKYKFNDFAAKSLESVISTFFTRTTPQIGLASAVVVTNSPLLSVSKITNRLNNKYVVLDLNYILQLLSNDFHELMSELERNNVEETCVIVCDLKDLTKTENSYSTREKMRNIASVVVNKNKIVVTNKTNYDTILQYFPEICAITYYDRHSMQDFDLESQEDIKNNVQLTFQGQNVHLGLIVDGTATSLIKGDVLDKIIHGKTIVIGDSPADPKYDKLNFFVDRRIKRNDRIKHLRTLHSVKDSVTLLTAKPGMGKSTLLAYLALATKDHSRRLWILTINLLDFSGELNRLKIQQRRGESIDILKALTFMCNIILNSRNRLEVMPHKTHKLNITLAVSNGEVYLKEFNGDDWSRFELKMFLHCYNGGNVMFLFDGFDEIYLRYAETVLTIINLVKNDLQLKKIGSTRPLIWITSRSYNKIDRVLQDYFGTPYQLEHLSADEVCTYLDNYWETNLIFTNVNKIQRIKILIDNTLAETVVYIAKLSRSLGRVLGSFLLHLIKNFPELNGASRWRHLYFAIMYLRLRLPEEGTPSQHYETECPLLTYLAAEYFIKLINENTTDSFNINITDVYNYFIEAILEKHYKDKKKIDLNIALNFIEYEDELPIYIEKHKRAAAYTMFKHDANNIFDITQIDDINYTIDTIRQGVEATGLTCNVTDNLPQYVHISLAQHLAAEFLFDFMKTMNEKKRKVLANIMFNQIDSFCLWIDQKLGADQCYHFNSYELRNFYLDENVVVDMVPIA